MAIYTKESLETLRQRIDLPDLLSTHLEMKKSGASYKALCPFHDEKSPSFMVQKGDSHYHCFGCGAHGDAISFLMTYLKMSFTEAVESLAERFHVPLEKVEGEPEKKGPSKAALKEALDHAHRFYHFMLLHSSEGHEALQYLYSRGIDLTFIRQFELGLAPKAPGLFRKAMHAAGMGDQTLADAGLLAPGRNSQWRDFFYDRITFPIRDAAGSVIGFSARKFKEETFGGKYVNTPETPLFKKSRVLFGLNFSRKRIAKERRALVVEGQIDALRLIQAGFNFAVAGQGTAFGELHVKELLNLGVQEVYLAMDSDDAGQEAAAKIGHLFQKAGAGVRIVAMPPGSDPDAFLQTKGPEAFLKLLEESSDYITFLFRHEAKKVDSNSPAGKNELVQSIARRVREWEQPVMVYESLRKLAHTAQVPEHMVDIDQDRVPNFYIRKGAAAGYQMVDPDRILETDFLRWLVVAGQQHPQFLQMAQENLTAEQMRVPACQKFYQTLLEGGEGLVSDLLTLAASLEEEAQGLLGEIHQKKVNRERAQEEFRTTLQKLLDRDWMQKREQVRMKITSGSLSDDEALQLAKEFDELKKAQPQIREPV